MKCQLFIILLVYAGTITVHAQTLTNQKFRYITPQEFFFQSLPDGIYQIAQRVWGIGGTNGFHHQSVSAYLYNIAWIKNMITAHKIPVSIGSHQNSYQDPGTDNRKFGINLCKYKKLQKVRAENKDLVKNNDKECRIKGFTHGLSAKINGDDGKIEVQNPPRRPGCYVCAEFSIKNDNLISSEMKDRRLIGVIANECKKMVI